MRGETVGWWLIIVVVVVVFWAAVMITTMQHEECGRQLALAPTISDTLQVVSANHWCHLE